MKDHITVLGVLHILFGAMGLALSGFIGILFMGIALFSGDPDAVLPLMVIGPTVAGIVAIVSLPGVLAGWGLLRRRVWARYLAALFGALMLVKPPLGTLFGIYTLWVLLHSQTPALFGQGATAVSR